MLILNRKKAKGLNKIGWSNRKIVRYLVANKDIIGNWLKIDEYEIEVNQRCLKNGTQRLFRTKIKFLQKRNF